MTIPRSLTVAVAAGLGTVLAGCAGTGQDGAVADRAVPLPEAAPREAYLGVETRLLGGDLVKFRVRMAPGTPREVLVAYAECAAAQYALIRGYGFARHLRTNVYEEAGIWQADAVYTISPALPEGLRTIDAEVVVANCKDNGIPTV